MGFLDEVRALLRRETRDAKVIMDEAVEDANASLDRAERRTSADPDERLAATLDDISASEDDFAAIRAKADAASARPVAEAELSEAEQAQLDGQTDDGGGEGAHGEPPGR